jgi:hypothetical protein
MTRISIRALLIAGLCAAATLHAQSRESLFDAFKTDSGWKADGARATYESGDLDRFDPAMAPALKRYRINGVSVQAWSSAQGRVRATVYEMAHSPAAYGLFSIKRNVDAPGYASFPFGAEGFRVERRATFWKGPFLVELEGDPAAVDEWARLAAFRIDSPSTKPVVSGHLPTEHRAAASDKYIVSASDIDATWDIDVSQLGFENDAQVATARYLIHGKPIRLMLVMYPTQQVAKRHEERMTTASGKPLAFKKRDGPLVAIVEPGADAASAEVLLPGIQHEFEVTWNEVRPGPNIVEIVLTIFRFIGIALAITVIAGIAFGVIRIVVKRALPGQVFDRPNDIEVIQLKLNQLFRRWSRGPHNTPPQGPAQ